MTKHLHGGAAAVLAIMTLATALDVAASEAELSSRILRQDGWISYQVPMVSAAGSPCCYDYFGKHVTRAACDLDGRSWNIGRNGNEPQHADDTAVLYVHVHGAQVDKLRAFGASCPVRGTEQVRRLDAVSSADSIAWLAQTLTRDDKFGDLADAQLAALALHEDTAATVALAKLSDATHPRKLRQQALFWSGHLRGVDGARLVERVATTDADAELRAEAVFALSQSSGIDAYTSIYRIAQTDSSEHVREQALFWMAQMGDARARADIVAAIDKEPSAKVREQAVFALSQLKDGQADAALIALVRGHYPRDVKQQALFWLGQSGSDEALHFIDEVLTHQAKR